MSAIPTRCEVLHFVAYGWWEGEENLQPCARLTLSLDDGRETAILLVVWAVADYLRWMPEPDAGLNLLMSGDERSIPYEWMDPPEWATYLEALLGVGNIVPEVT